MTEQHTSPDNNTVLKHLVEELLSDNRKARKVALFFRLAIAAYVLVLTVLWSGIFEHSEKSEPHVAVVNIKGQIGNDTAVTDSILESLNEAMENKQSAGVILRINSPGGSPVQSGIINDEVQRLRHKYPKKHIYAVVEDICASGGYYIAVSAEKIFVNKASMVGSIGVIMDGFGFTGTMKLLGVERRALHAGDNKALMDPFSPLNEKHVAFINGMLDEVHQQFIDAVVAGRGEKIKANGPEIFSGLIWTGSKAVKMGLADEINTVNGVARDVFKQENLVDYTQSEPLFEKIGKKIGASVGTSFAAALPESVEKIQLH